METFIQFVLKNFFVVIVIAGFIFSVINKARKSNPGSQNRMPSFGGNPMLPGSKGQRQSGASPSTQPRQPVQTRQPVQIRPSGQPASSGAESSDSRGGESQRSDSLGRSSSSQMAETDGRASWMERDESSGRLPLTPTDDYTERSSFSQAGKQKERSFDRIPLAETTSRATEVRRDASAQRGTFRMPDGDELRRAFVLAEVLGPPRAKRPFRKP